MNPRPSEAIPIWIGGSSAGALRRAAWCDGWHGTWAPLDEFKRRVLMLLAELEKIERDRAEVTVSIHMEVTIGDGLDYSGWSSVGDGYGDRRPVTGRPEDVAGLLVDYAEAGLDHVLVTPVVRGARAWDEMILDIAALKDLVQKERALSLGFSQMHHIGIVVSDLDGAMKELSSQLALTWAPIRHGERIVRHLGRLVTTDLRLTYSIEGPPHLELIGEARGTPWEPTGGGIHHTGFWVQDLRGTGLELARAGMRLEATYDAEDGGLLGFAYFTDANGFRVEILDDSRRKSFDDWLAGGPG